MWASEGGGVFKNSKPVLVLFVFVSTRLQLASARRKTSDFSSVASEVCLFVFFPSRPLSNINFGKLNLGYKDKRDIVVVLLVPVVCF